jgi:hypothetical protein
MLYFMKYKIFFSSGGVSPILKGDNFQAVVSMYSFSNLPSFKNLAGFGNILFDFHACSLNFVEESGIVFVS